MRRSKIIGGVIRLTALLASHPLLAQQEDSITQFPSAGERRIEIVGEKIESLGCILDKNAILGAKDGEVVVCKHKADPKGDVTVVFNHQVLPKGNWVLHGAKNSLKGGECEKAPGKSPKRMEAVSVLLSGLEINSQPRDLDGTLVYTMAFVQLKRLWGWDIGLAHSWESGSAVHSFGYWVPEKSMVGKMKFGENQIPIVNILHHDEQGKLLAGALFWFENHAPHADPKSDENRKPESEKASQQDPQK